MIFGDLFSNTLSIVLKVIKQRLLMVNTDKPMKKRMELQSSSSKNFDPPVAPSRTSSEMDSSQRERALARKWKQKFDEAEAEKKKLTEELSAERDKVRNAEKRITELEKDLAQSRLATERANREMDETAKMNKKIEALNIKAGSGFQGCSGLGLSQKIKDNFMELAETELQCAVCFEVFMDATTISCGHTFCKNCICEWQKRNSNCPLCRMDIKHMVEVKTLDCFVEKFEGYAYEAANSRSDYYNLIAMKICKIHKVMEEKRIGRN